MAIKVFTAGQTVRLWGSFTGEDGQPVDPTTVTVTVQDAAGDASTPSVTRDSVGVYFADVTVDVAATDTPWLWRMVGTGAYAQVEFGRFKVIPAPFS